MRGYWKFTVYTPNAGESTKRMGESISTYGGVDFLRCGNGRNLVHAFYRYPQQAFLNNLYRTENSDGQSCVGHWSECLMRLEVSNASKLFSRFQIHGNRLVKLCMTCKIYAICFGSQTVETIKKLINLVSAIINS